MEQKKTFYKSFLLCLIILTICINGRASSIRIQSIGNTTLITEDEDNQINLFDFGQNPAWLIKDQNRQWLKVIGKSDFQHGNFHRTYDPDEVTDIRATFEGVKPLARNQIFRGVVDYGGLFKYGVHKSVTREPYANHPYRLTDNTTGDINYSGPKILAQYCCKLYRDKLFIAGTVDYQIETGLKEAVIQPRTTYRCIGIGTAMALNLSQNITLGAVFHYSNSQEYIEYKPPTTYESQTIYIKKFKGESIARPGNTYIEIFNHIHHYQLGFQSILNTAKNFKVGMKITGNFKNLKVTESQRAPVNEGTWKLAGYEFNLKTRYKIGHLPWYLGISFDRIYHNDWAIHPEFDILFADDFFSGNYWGVGIAYAPSSGRLYLAGEIHKAISHIKKQDYVSQLNKSGNIVDDEIKLGLEYLLFKRYFMRTGFMFTNNRTATDLLAFSEYENKYRKYSFTGGLGLKFNSFEADFHFEYSQKASMETSISGKRKYSGIYVMIKFLK